MSVIGTMIGRWGGLSGLVIATGILASGTAFAADIADQNYAAPIGGWRYQVSLDGWLAGLNGKIGIRDLPDAHVNESPWDVLKDLDAAVAGTIQATDGNWLLYSDFMWAKVSSDAEFGPAHGTIDFEQRQIILTALLGHSLPVNVENMELFATAGLRYQRNRAELSIEPALFPNVDREGSKGWVDPIIGLSMHYDFNNRWFMDVNADIGGFGVSSDFTAQAKAVVGYKWSETFSSTFGYKALYTDFSDDGFRYKVTQHGVFTAVVVNF